MEVKMLQFQSQLGGFERINPEFAKVKVHIMYEGLNRNRSIFSRETIVEKMLPTLYNCPVVGEWISENDNFGSHGGKIEISDKGMELIDTTRPYGVIPSNSEITWETIREKDGMTEHEYLTCTAYLWVGRYPELEKVINDGANQSMEIYPTKYHYDEDDNMVVEDAYFSALCILGKDTDPNKNFEPCFESADIQRYSLDKEKFKLEFNALIQELKTSFNNSEKEVDSMEDNLIDVPVEEVVNETVNEEPTVDNNVNEEVVTEVQQSEVEEQVVVEQVDYEAQLQELKQELENKDNEIFNLNTALNNIKQEYDTLQNEVKELREYKITLENEKIVAEKQQVFSKYSVGLTTDEMKPVMDRIDTLSVSEIKAELNDIFTTKTFSEISKKFNLENKDVVMDMPKKDNAKSKYAVV